MQERKAEISRVTGETNVHISLDLDGTGKAQIHTGIGFFDHMLNSFARHGLFDLTVDVQGDLEVDSHHTIEDTGIVLGQAFKEALKNSGPICRYGSAFIPMDEALGFAALDISNRPYLVFSCDFKADKMGDMDTQMVEEFMRAFAFQAGITLHLKAEYGANDHHKAEALFKALAHALTAAAAPTGGAVLSTKGML